MGKRLIYALITTGLAFACTQDLYDDPIPFVPFPDYELTLNNEPKLLTDGGTILINNDVGVRGVILYRKNASTFYAFERNCSFHPNDACATVEVHSSTLYMFDACCGSTFNFEGDPTGGPAWRALRRYYTYYDSGTGKITITDEIVE